VKSYAFENYFQRYLLLSCKLDSVPQEEAAKLLSLLQRRLDAYADEVQSRCAEIIKKSDEFTVLRCEQVINQLTVFAGRVATLAAYANRLRELVGKGAVSQKLVSDEANEHLNSLVEKILR
jgi:hypothetical protein